LIGKVQDVNLEGIDWVIAGGESGPFARPVEKEWITDIRDICNDAMIPFFFKQWGGTKKKKAGRTLDGRTWDEYPVAYKTYHVPATI
jgi:protein gp37